jgi:hypothetical protein
MSQTKKVSKITIRNKHPDSVSTGANTEILLNGMPLPSVSFVKIEIKAKKIAKVMLEMYANVEIDLSTHPELREVTPKPGPVYAVGKYSPIKIQGE